MIETIKVTGVIGKMSKANKPYYTVKGNNGTADVIGNCFDEKCVGTEGKSVDFDVQISGEYRNYTLKQVHAGSPEQESNKVAPVSPPVVNNKLEALKCAISVAKILDKEISSDNILAVAKKFDGYLSE